MRGGDGCGGLLMIVRSMLGIGVNRDVQFDGKSFIGFLEEGVLSCDFNF